MPQALLPDINFLIQGQFVSLGIAISQRDGPATSNTIHALNALLPPKYQLVFSTQEYRKERADRIAVTCPQCNMPTDMIHTHDFHLANSYYENIMGYIENRKYVVCSGPDCKHHIALDPTTNYEVYKMKLDDYKAIYAPNEPDNNGIIYDSINQSNFWKWSYICRTLILYKMRQYREDYKSKNDMDGDI